MKDLTVPQAARRLRISLDALYRLLYAGKLAGRKRDGRWVIPAQAVEDRRSRR